MAEKFCFIFSRRTGSIIILSFPVMLIIQGAIFALHISSSAISVPGYAIFGLVILAISCTIGLLGVEQKTPSFLLPAIWMIIILIISNVIRLISYILDYFQLANIQDDTLKSNDQFFYIVTFTAMLMYAFITISDHFEDLKKFANQESYRDLPPSVV